MTAATDLPDLDLFLRAALAEDIGTGDLTTRLTVRPGTRARAKITAKEAGVIAGTGVIPRVISILGGDVDVQHCITDGTRVLAGGVVAALAGSAHTLLAMERVTLNLLQHLSGIATLTAELVTAVKGCGCRIVDTRKTIPGLRALQKYAVRVGGGFNHRLRLDDGILIKENHIAAAGSVAAAVAAAQAGAPHGIRVEVECRTIDDVREALSANAEMILLDNMSVDELAEAVRCISGRAVVEASGGISLSTVRDVACTGVDVISVGALTHSARALDLSMTLAME
jgi:nicotinate-nucleotide pyrophosphorylase (carboxylating)